MAEWSMSRDHFMKRHHKGQSEDVGLRLRPTPKFAGCVAELVPLNYNPRKQCSKGTTCAEIFLAYQGQNWIDRSS